MEEGKGIPSSSTPTPPPSNSSSSDPPQQEQQQRSAPANAESGTSEGGVSEAGRVVSGMTMAAAAATVPPGPPGLSPNEDAFSSSSEEDDDEDDDDNIKGSKQEDDKPAPPPPPPLSDKGREASGAATGVVSGIVSEWDRALQSGQARHVTAPAFEAPKNAHPPSTSHKNTIISVHEPADNGQGDRRYGEYPHDNSNTSNGYDDDGEYEYDGPTPSIEVVPSRDNDDDEGNAEVVGMAAASPGQDTEQPIRRGNGTLVTTANRRRATPTMPTAAPSSALSTPQRSNVAATQPAAAMGNDHLSSGVLPDVLMTMRLRIESLQLFDSDILKLAEPSLGTGASSSSSQLLRPLRQGQRYNNRGGRRRLPPNSPNSGGGGAGDPRHPLSQLQQGSSGPNDHDEYDDDYYDEEEDEDYRESLKRSSQQSISAAVLVSLAHKRYERRRLAAMELEKICRALLYQNETERIRAILLLLSDDYVRSTSEDARKGGVVALAACAIALKRGNTSGPSTSSASSTIAGGTAGGSSDPIIDECRDLILASVVHACQDHSSRVRYYATESLFNVVKVMPAMAVQHFFILFEILRSLYADVDADVRSGAELLDRKLKEVIVAAMNAGTFAPEFCLPVFCRFVYLRHKATKQLTLSWLQELHDKLLDQNPILEFLHLFVGGVFDMVADPTVAIRESAIYFLQSVLPKLLLTEDDPSGASCAMVDFDKILQSLVTTMEHPDPFVRKVSMYWMSRIVKSHCDPPAAPSADGTTDDKFGTAAKSEPAPMSPDDEQASYNQAAEGGGMNADLRASRSSSHRHQSIPPPPPPPPPLPLSAASISVRNSLPHILPGILLSIGDDFEPRPKSTKGGNGAAGANKESFLPEFTTRELARQTNYTLQAAVRRDGPSFVPYLDGFIVALREELDSPRDEHQRAENQPPAPQAAKEPDHDVPAAGLSALRYPPPVERTPYRIDVNQDGTGIESPGWFSSSVDDNAEEQRNSESTVMSRLCALDWVVVLYESVVPILLKADYAREFVFAIIHQLMDSAPKSIVYKSLEVLAKITVPVQGESGQRSMTSPSVVAAIANPTRVSDDTKGDDGSSDAKARRSPMNESNISYAFDILEPERRAMMSRNREVFSALIDLYSCNMSLMDDLSSVLAYMCRLQPSEFVFVSFAVELDKFISSKVMPKPSTSSTSPMAPASDLRFVSSFVQNLNHVLLNKPEAKPMRDALRDCVRFPKAGPTLDERARQRSRLFHIMLHSFAHNLAATISLCIWAGAYRTTSLFLNNSDPLDINLMFLLEVDRFIEHLERPLFRHLHVRMLEVDVDPDDEGSGSMLFKALKALLMMLPQSTCYHILKDRLVSVSRFRQSSFAARARPIKSPLSKTTASNSSGIVTAATARIAGAAKLSSSAANLPGSLGSINTVGGNGASLGPDIGGAGGIYLSRVLDVRALHCETAWRTIRSESLVVRADPAVDESDENYGTKASSRRDWLGYASEAEEAKAHEARRHQLKSSLGRESDVQPQKYSDLSTLATTDALGGADEAKDSAAEESHGALRPDSEPCQDENCEWKTYWEGSAVS